MHPLYIIVFILFLVSVYSLVRVHALENRLQSVSQGMATAIEKSNLNEQNTKVFVDYVLQVFNENGLASSGQKL